MKWETGVNPVQCRCCENGATFEIPLGNWEGEGREEVQVRIPALVGSLCCGLRLRRLKQIRGIF